MLRQANFLGLGEFGSRPSSSRLRSVLRHGSYAPCHRLQLVPAVPDFDRCSDKKYGKRKDRVACPSSSRLRSVLRHGRSHPRIAAYMGSQQFPTSIGAQTINPDASREGDTMVPAVPDFDRCSDAQEGCASEGAATRPSSSRLRSVLRPRPPKPLKLHHNEGSFRAPPSTARTKRTPKGRRLLQVPFGTCFFRCRAPPGKSVLRGCSKPRAPISKIEKLPQGMTHLERWDEGLASAEQRPIADERSIPAPGRGCQPVWFKRSSDACP